MRLELVKDGVLVLGTVEKKDGDLVDRSIASEGQSDIQCKLQ